MDDIYNFITNIMTDLGGLGFPSSLNFSQEQILCIRNKLSSDMLKINTSLEKKNLRWLLIVVKWAPTFVRCKWELLVFVIF